jgi:hypothetical protein
VQVPGYEQPFAFGVLVRQPTVGFQERQCASTSQILFSKFCDGKSAVAAGRSACATTGRSACATYA